MGQAYRRLVLALTLAATTLGTAGLLIPPQLRPESAAAVLGQLGIWKESRGEGGLTFQGGNSEGDDKSGRRVPVDLGVMSQCPDAQVS
jgi:hypothetical protein